MSDRDASISCLACHADNRGHRGYCRGCGASLQPVCRGCRFVNDRGDRFCGGCGSELLEPAGRHTAAAPLLSPPARSDAGRPRTTPPSPSANTALATSHDELAALLAPLAAKPSDELPSAGITQADLDRLFGGTS